MKSIYQMELEDKFNRKIKYREKKLKNQRMIIGKQQEEIERLNNIINELEKWSEEYRFADIFKNKLQELKGSDK